MARHLHAGNESHLVAESTCIGPCDPAETIHVVVMLRRQQEQHLDSLLQGLSSGDPGVKPVSREAFAQRFGAHPDDVMKVEAFAQQRGLAVARVDPVESLVVLSGTIAQFEAAFGVKLERFEHRSIGQYRGRTGDITLPDELHGIVTAVLGLDDRPQARPHFRLRPTFLPARAPAVTYTPPQLAALYDFPPGDGAGQCIAIVELGGGYRPAEIQQYFGGLGLARQPKLVDVSVGAGRNAPTGDPSGPDGEVALDIEIAGAIAPGATIAVYFAQNSDAGFIQAVNQAVHDTTNRPSVVSISWGAAEANWTSQSIQAFDSVLQSAAALGVTVCAASGDDGSNDGLQDGTNHVDFPASSPYVLACGGTRLDALPGQGIRSEVVWNDEAAGGGATGGGVSAVFDVPQWQSGLSATLAQGGGASPLAKRGVPDVAGDASPAAGYEVFVAGTSTVMGGTSAVAPLWAALVARINAAAGSPAGWINPKLYRNAGALHDISVGDNGAYAATPGWDACTGLGSPDGAKVAAALKGGAAG
ncbi:protease pro-enzyme activation domain-containing protein [Burkholderia pseudomallei]|uniref:S53 family peptidase n=1 Tax=Burkholderia pseudomallei TaxID=28450 RepID=UPI0001990F41|nr:S53 family peptidase [Burkholderia pseudomallei]AIO83835.1 kumamolisin [Burkholderia pseudomallei]EEH27929.1 serine protease, subtilase family [Burkholderia pseudomallei Pakistan 9]ONB93354.1 peptidase S53 [Burkholderia pseudomallei]CAK0254631.1 serine protease, kumamolysin [Burkholderia pseudomallei]